MATTAVVVGTANVVNNAMAPKPAQVSQQDAAAMQQQAYAQGAQDQANAQQAAAQQAAAAPAGGMTQQQINELQQLAQLKDQGILTQEEFDAKKKQILGL
jgi:predicted Zn-dependent peptidase